jgi:hypothetical protein
MPLGGRVSDSPSTFGEAMALARSELGVGVTIEPREDMSDKTAS